MGTLQNKTYLNKKEIEKLIDLYKCGQSTREIGYLLNCSSTTVGNFLKANGIIPRKKSCYRKYELNHNFFEVIDSEEKAYFLGLLYADGYLNEKMGCCTLALQEDDIDILNEFKKYLETDSPLDWCNKNKEEHHKKLYKISIRSKKFISDLKKLGVYQGKSLTLKFPTEKQVPSYLLRHFIRGVFDGDGCLTFQPLSTRITIQGTVSIVSTLEFINKLRKIVEKNVDIHTLLTKRFKNNVNCYNFTLSGNIQILKFLNWIYKDCNVRMNRKYNNFLNFIKIIINHNKLGKLEQNIRYSKRKKQWKAYYQHFPDGVKVYKNLGYFPSQSLAKDAIIEFRIKNNEKYSLLQEVSQYYFKEQIKL